MILGGGYLSEYNASLALGVNPGAAGGNVVIDNTSGPGAFTMNVGSYIVYAFDSLAAFHGIITEVGESTTDPTSGTVHRFTVSDNRIRLQWQMVFGCFNMEDENWTRRLGRPVAPSAPGDVSSGGSDDVDVSSGLTIGSVQGAGDPPDPGNTASVRRRYKSKLPQNWAAGVWVWHDQPFTAREILNFAFNGAWGDFGFSRSYHSSLDNLILTNLDYDGGVKLSNLITEINEKAGLEISISGSRLLKWHRKGEGLLPIPDNASRDLSSGSSLTANDTKVRLVGERIRIQVCNVELEPDWVSGWEAFIDEVAWRREVASAWALPTETKAEQAELSALARKVTVFDYAKKKNDPELLDPRSFGRTSRNSMAAWAYLQEIVFRSYRIPPTKTLYGIPVSSLEMADSLICATDVTGEGDAAKQIYATDPIEFYPSAQAQAIVKGQPLDLISSRDIRLFYRNRLKDLREEWTVANDFEVDSANMSIRFAAPMFIDGLASEGKSLFLKLNKGEGGGTDLTELVEENSDYLDVIVPNPDCTIAAASVKASFCFLAGRLHKDFGSGPRRAALNVPGLSLHLLDTKGGIGGGFAGTAAFDGSDLTVPDTSGSTFREVLYEDGGRALEKAASAAESITALTAVQSTGGFHRTGAVTGNLSGVVDRINISVTMSGISETIGFTKARPTGVAFAERTLARIQRSAELFPGQEQLRKEIREYRALAAAFRSGKSAPVSTTHHRFEDAFTKPVGAENPSTKILYDKNSAAPTRGEVKEWRAGDVVWVDAQGWPSATGRAFGGILVAKPVSIPGEDGEEDSQSKDLVVATRGIVPVRIRGAVTAGAMVSANPGEHYAGSAGSRSIGYLMHGEDVPVPAADAEVLAMVSLGGGGGGTGPCPFGEIITFTEGEGEAAEQITAIRGGLVLCGDQNWNFDPEPVDLDASGAWLVYLSVSLEVHRDDDNEILLPGVKTGTKPAGPWSKTVWTEDADYPANTLPGAETGTGTVILPLGKLTVADGAATFAATGCGNFTITHCAGTLGYARS